MSSFQLRRLEARDVDAYRALRLDGLKRHPESFGASYEDEAKQPLDWFANRLTVAVIVGAFDTVGALVGVAGLTIPSAIKTRHKGILWGMYVLEAARGCGVSQRLVEAVIDEARGKVEQLQLTVVSSNAVAIRLYSKLGFVGYGLEARALCVDGQYFDEMLMALPHV
ncbi:Mycothiol acetyltransferase [Ensifer adhaerens]|uniref:GNAT family N-acetyltransferase n=1 Tax=Ensifer adhaerens TaxID=106592 RepID=UPI001569DCDA|nr:GNAT family N-acetyltransferase [Ensifer adhaerens]NRP19258.1 Mycothiol acetyltransferase [Ensifer adhaerens]